MVSHIACLYGTRAFCSGVLASAGMIKCRVLGPESMNKCLPKQLNGGCLEGKTQPCHWLISGPLPEHPGTFVPLNVPRHTGKGWWRSVLSPCRPYPPHSFPGLGAHILRASSPSVCLRCHPHLTDTHLTLGPMGSVSTAQMRHKPAKGAQGHPGSPLAGGAESCQCPTILRSPVED